MASWDASGLEREPFDGRRDAPVTSYRGPARRGHGPRCSSDPEVGCVCGADERQSQDHEARSLGFRSHEALVEAMGPERMAALARRHGPDICPNPRRCENCAA